MAFKYLEMKDSENHVFFLLERRIFNLELIAFEVLGLNKILSM